MKKPLSLLLLEAQNEIALLQTANAKLTKDLADTESRGYPTYYARLQIEEVRKALAKQGDELDRLLEIRFDSDAGDNLTIRGYFHALLRTLWDEGEGFSGKRPFGNSGWEGDLYLPLVKAGAVPGQLSPDGYLDDCDEKIANDLVRRLIERALHKEPIRA